MGLIDKLSGGERRSIGCAPEVAQLVLAEPGLLDELFIGLLLNDVVVRSRTAHSLYFIADKQPELLQPYKQRIFAEIAPIPQWEVRQQVCKILVKLELSETDLDQALRLFMSYLEDRSSIVKTCAMQGLADLTLLSPELTPNIKPLLLDLTLSGTAAMRARGRKLLAKMADQ